MNPVEQRVAQMCQAWAAFTADPAKRLLVWRIQEDALRMVDVFVEMQKHQTELTTGDTFVLSKAAYQHGLQYSRELKEGLVGQYEATREDLPKQGLPADWHFDPAATADTPAGMAQALLSFGSKYHQAVGHLTLVLHPLKVASSASWVDWLTGLLDVGLPERLRVLVIEIEEYARVRPLLARSDPRVLVQDLGLDMATLAQETFAQEKTTGPAGTFRNLLMGVVTLAEKGSADQVKAKAVDALKFTQAQKWPDQEVAVRILVAGALLKESRHAEAIKVYEVARQAAEACVQIKHPAGHKLVLQTWFGQAGAQLAQGDDRAAATSYDEAATVAQLDNNPILAIEGFRMAGFCLARAGERDPALQRGECAVGVAQALPPEARAMTTIGVCIVDMLRLLEPDRVQQMQQVKRQLKGALDQIRDRAEPRGAELVAQGHPDALAQVDKEQEQQRARVIDHARGLLDQLATSGTEPFVGWVRQGDELLGGDWMLANDLALPPLYQPEDAQDSSS